jgi:hypothetical protein
LAELPAARTDETDDPCVATDSTRLAVAVAIAAGVGLAAAHLTFGVNTAPAGSESALAWPFHYLLVGPIAGLLYYFVIAATLERTVPWVAACAFGGYVCVSWFAWPVLLQRPAAAIGEPGGAAAAALGGSGVAAREEWLRRLIAAGRYGEPGAPPPMLEVRPSDTGAVGVRNVSGATLVLSAAIVAADAASSGGWRGCAYSGYAGEGAQEWVELTAGQSAIFELEPLCREIFLDLESYMEFRVGNEAVPVEEGWWSTSALVAPRGRAAERASGNAVLPSSYDARNFYGAAGRESRR